MVVQRLELVVVELELSKLVARVVVTVVPSNNNGTESHRSPEDVLAERGVPGVSRQHSLRCLGPAV